jgi:hypothetical protein
VPRNFLDSLCWTWSVLDTTAFQKKSWSIGRLLV